MTDNPTKAIKPASLVAQLQKTAAEYPQHSAFSIYQGYVWYQPAPKTGRNGEEHEQKPIKVCSELQITARTRDDDGRNHGRLLEFKDMDNKQKIIPMPCSELQADGLEARKKLSDEGLYINPHKNARPLLIDYILNSKPEQTALCVERTGWHEHLFILPGHTIGRSQSERCLFQSKALNHEAGIDQKGTLEQWQELAGLLTGNSRLVFAVSSGFAAPLLSLVDMESGGFNFFGESSIGKSTALLMACSVYGSPEYRQQWRSTINGLEAVCTAHNDCLLVVDEMGEMEPKDLGKSCYMVANGQGKARANATTRNRWRTLMLSSAESNLAQFMNETGRPVKAGQQVRLIDIPANAGAGFGAFEDLKGFDSPSKFSDALRDKAKKSYGVSVQAYLESLSLCLEQDRLAFVNRINQFTADFKSQYEPAQAGGQVSRGATRFALVAFAGELATEEELTGWQSGEATEAAAICFQAWISHRGGTGSQEEKDILGQVEYFFQKHFDSGFVEITDTESNPPYRKGFRHLTPSGDVEFWVLPEIFKQEIAKNYDPKLVIKYCLNNGYLLPHHSGDPRQTQKIPVLHGNKKTAKKVYVFSDRVLGETIEEETTTDHPMKSG